MLHPRGLFVAVVGLGVLISLALSPSALAVAKPRGGGGSTVTGTVFFPNPVQQLGRQDLTDNKDADYPALQPAYRSKTLRDLDGSGTLTGAYVRVKSETGKAVSFSGSSLPAYHRDADQFEQVMGYYWVTEAQHYIQSLGIGRPVNARQIALRINQFGGDNSFFRENKADITLGKGGVDDAEDAEVIVHEYGHSVQDGQVPGFGTNLESGSIGEGFSDYLAVAVTSALAGKPADEPCVADWDSVSYTDAPHCLRRVDGDEVYPRDLNGEVHDDGEIWSAALYDVRTALGNAHRADRIIVGAQFGFARDTSMRRAAAVTIAYAKSTDPGAAAAVKSAFAGHGLA